MTRFAGPMEERSLIAKGDSLTTRASRTVILESKRDAGKVLKVAASMVRRRFLTN